MQVADYQLLIEIVLGYLVLQEVFESTLWIM